MIQTFTIVVLQLLEYKSFQKYVVCVTLFVITVVRQFCWYLNYVMGTQSTQSFQYKQSSARLLSFPARFGKQFYALLYKHGLVAARSWRATTMRLLASFLFLFLVFIIDLAIQADNSQRTQFKSVRDPQAEVVESIPKCEDDLYHNKDRECYDFYYSPSTEFIREQIVKNIQKNNGRQIEDSKVLAFENRTIADDWLLKNPEQVQGGIHFVMDDDVNPTSVDFIVQFNSTVKFFRSTFQDPQTFIQLPLQMAAHREVSRYLMKNATESASMESFSISYKTFAHPQIDTFSLVGSISGNFLFAANMFGFVALLVSLLYDKESGLKTAMVTMGMLDSSYWISWLSYELVFTFISSLLMVVFGLVFQFDMFLNNDFGLLLMLFWLFQMAMSSLAMMISPFLRKAAVAVYLGFAIFIIGWIMQIVVTAADYPFSPEYYKDFGGIITAIFTLLPWSLFSKGISDLGTATSSSDSPGIRWSQRFSYCKNWEESDRESYKSSSDVYVDLTCVFSLGQIYLIFLAQWFVYFILAMYLDCVIPNENGVRRPPWYVFMPTYWFPNSHACQNKQLKRPMPRQNSFSSMEDQALLADEDVVAEEQNMLALLKDRQAMQFSDGGQDQTNLAVEIFGLQKRFGGNFWAVKGTWLSIQHNQLFCLLGPNGAGKTTTINCLTGIIPTSGGDAVICGHRLSSPGGLDQIRSLIGVCPQFDTLYAELTGREQLWIYAQIKGIPSKAIKLQVEKLLEQVKLLQAGSQRTGSYSGGMRRRLSVAVALLGDPQVVFLDEPTTGMDPIARRYVWDIIQDAKKGRAIILTTHSMEEADILGDVVGIMARGRLRCLGSSLRLKQKFGAGYLVGVSVVSQKQLSTNNVDKINNEELGRAVKQFFQQEMGIAPTSEDKAYIHFVIPKDKEQQLSSFLAKLEQQKQQLQLSDVRLALTTLQDVFIKIAREVEVQHSRLIGAKTAVQLPTGQKILVEKGQEFTTSQGESYQIKWSQDEMGNLVVLEVVNVAATLSSNNIASAN
eukprot:TRINITY_DN5830_c0_g3_i2.p1 TRINITY_DN5830_c0_g3~~TRINITY_DN5830_c0_g3_i2.p1  ORF type:complete len:1015 (-),score=90.81 TRINITY_DN5830_c0_g3_i2:310-3354(-)